MVSGVLRFDIGIYRNFPLPSARQHSSCGDCLEVSREYHQNSSVLDCMTQNVHSPQHTYMSSSYRSNRLGLSHGTLMLCIEVVAWSCINVTWWSGSGWIQAWSRRPAGFLQCFDTVGLVIWPVKIVPETTYYVSSGTLNPTHPYTIHLMWCCSDVADEITGPATVREAAAADSTTSAAITATSLDT